MTDDYDRNDDFRRSIEFAYRFIRARVAGGGTGWREYGTTLGRFDTPGGVDECNRLPGGRDQAETRS